MHRPVAPLNYRLGALTYGMQKTGPNPVSNRDVQMTKFRWLAILAALIIAVPSLAPSPADARAGEQFADRFDGGDDGLAVVDLLAGDGLLGGGGLKEAGQQQGGGGLADHSAFPRMTGPSEAGLTDILANTKLASMNVEDLRSRAGEAASFLKSIANDRRLIILCELVNGERTVGELEAIVGLSQSALSQHLAKLRDAKLVKTRRESQTIHYSLADSSVSKVIGVLHDVYCKPARRR